MVSDRSFPPGFTLLEMLIALTVAALLVNLGLLGIRQLEQTFASRTLARQIASTLRFGRSQAVAANREMRVEFLPNGESSGGQRPAFCLQGGNLPRNSTVWENYPKYREEFPTRLAMGVGPDCAVKKGYISFNPNGSSNALYVCILERSDQHILQRRYAVGVSHAATGRVQILHWSPNLGRFK